MSLWLILIILGVVLLVIGVAVEAAQILIWIGVAILVVSLIMSLLNRGKNRV
jgi:membrane-bound ClpP family serine protease